MTPKNNATNRLNKLAAEKMGNGEQIFRSTGTGQGARGWFCWSATERKAWLIGINEVAAAKWINEHHRQILDIVSELCPGGEVRVVYEPLRRPCDYAVVVGGSYTVAAPAPAGWAEVTALQAAGFDFSAAFERVFDRDWAQLHLNGCSEKQRLAIDERIATNVALDAAVAAIYAPAEKHARIQHQERWLGLHLSNIAHKVQAYADRIKRSVAYSLNGADIVCYPGEAAATAVRLWHEAINGRKPRSPRRQD